METNKKIQKKILFTKLLGAICSVQHILLVFVHLTWTNEIKPLLQTNTSVVAPPQPEGGARVGGRGGPGEQYIKRDARPDAVGAKSHDLHYL